MNLSDNPAISIRSAILSRSEARKAKSAAVPASQGKKRILWFTDTIVDLNGVAVTLRNIGWLAHKRGDEIFIVSSVPKNELDGTLPPNYINLKPLLNFRMPFYPTLTVKVPSFIAMNRMLRKYNADAVFLSSLSIVGFFGLMFSKLHKIESTAIFHTDFAEQASRIIGPKSIVTKFLEVYSRWFHEDADNLLVPTQEYINILGPRGFDTSRMGIFQRGIDTTVFYPVENAEEKFSSTYNVPGGINLLYTGRISGDKNLDFLIEAVKPVMERHPEINLVMAGEGPDLGRLKKEHKDNSRIFFVGKITNRALPEVYSAAKMLVFPSETDTFGMSVLESQACGIPALVSHIGGPRNIVRDGETGYVLSTEDRGLWTAKIEELVAWIKSNDPRYHALHEAALKHVQTNYDFDRIIDQFVASDEDKNESLEKIG